MKAPTAIKTPLYAQFWIVNTHRVVLLFNYLRSKMVKKCLNVFAFEGFVDSSTRDADHVLLS